MYRIFFTGTIEEVLCELKKRIEEEEQKQEEVVELHDTFKNIFKTTFGL